MIKKTFSVALCAAALSLCSTTQAQWPARWHETAVSDDEGQAVAVARDGSVYVAGKTKRNSPNWDFALVKYTSAGVKVWERQYFGPNNAGDDIATSIHVDPASRNVYVGGTSYGGTTSGFDFCVIAYDTNGNPIWPASGGGTGYAYHNGAVRTTSTLDEGGGSQGQQGVAQQHQVAMAVREDLAAENRLIAVTGIIARVGLPQGHYWRTVVFQPGTSNYPVLREGWPVDLDTPTDFDEIPRAVAIHTDNSVYVTGKTARVVDGQHVEDFTTVRYKPTGGHPTVAAFWRYDWNPSSGESKINSGVDIAVDRNGDAYATGYVNVSGVEFGTIAFRKDAVGGQAQLKGDDIWHTDGADYPNSISLTYEVENGALVPYAFVTGRSENSPNSDIATLRYRGDTLQRVWTTVHPGSGSDEGLDVVGAGYGNASVVGKIDNQLAVIGYRRDGTIRFGPSLYNNNGFAGSHEGRMGVMIGAGALAGTGVSQGTALADFVTHVVAQATTPSSPSGYTLPVGLLQSGTVANLASSDDQYLVFSDNPASEDVDVVRVEFTGATTVSNPTEICLYHEGRTANAPMAQTIEVWDWLVGGYLLVDARNSTTFDSRLVLVLKDDPSRFLSNGVFKVRFRYTTLPASDEVTYSVFFDQLTWEVLGQ